MSYLSTKVRVIAIVALVFVLLIASGSVLALVWYNTNISAVNSDCVEGDAEGECEAIAFSITEGMSSGEIAEKLEEKGAIRSSLAFRIYQALNAGDKVIQTGEYTLTKDMNVAKILENFSVGPDLQTFTITFLPGGTLAQARQRLKAKGYSDDEISEAYMAKYDHAVLKDKPTDASLEGYIYGETYEFYNDTPVQDILTRTFDELEKEVKNFNLEEKFKQKGLNLHEGIVLASIIQRESGILPNDMPQVAQVFYKRLESNIPLGSDAIYAYYADLQNPDRDKTDMTPLETTPCPWNSRRCKGLPPTAIASPGVGALEAAASPAKGDYVYFLTGDDGKMYYANTEAEHNENIRKYCQELCQIL